MNYLGFELGLYRSIFAIYGTLSVLNSNGLFSWIGYAIIIP